MKQKRTFQFILALFALSLGVLPILVSVNDILTKGVESLQLYSWVQETIVPWEIRLVGGIMHVLGIPFEAYPEGFRADGHYARLTWNCLGWQSMLFLLLSLPVGLRAGKYNLSSKVEMVAIGFLGTFLINIVRIVFTVILLVYSQRLFAIVFHDYLAAVMTIIWLTIFWWFSYSYVLVESESDLDANGHNGG